MKYCKKCRLNVETNENKCPLCYSLLTAEEGVGNSAKPDKYPPLEGIGVKKYSFRFRLLLFFSIFTGSLCLLINILTYTGTIWSLIVIGAILYWWLAVARPLYMKKKFGYRVVVQVIFLPTLLYIIERVSGTKGWALDIVTPFLFIACTIYITVLICVKGMKWSDYTSYQMVMGLMCLLPLIFYFLGILVTVWPGIISAFYSLMTFVGMRILADRKYENELIKRFHF